MKKSNKPKRLVPLHSHSSSSQVNSSLFQMLALIIAVYSTVHAQKPSREVNPPKMTSQRKEPTHLPAANAGTKAAL